MDATRIGLLAHATPQGLATMKSTRVHVRPRQLCCDRVVLAKVLVTGCIGCFGCDNGSSAPSVREVDAAAISDDAAPASDGGTVDVVEDGDKPSDVSDDCILVLASIVNVDHGCAASYEEALASVTCTTFNNGDNAMTGVCGALLRFSYGHDGLTSCTYDSSSHAVVGGTVCGIPPFYISSCGFCRSAGKDLFLSSCSQDALSPVCSVDASTD